MADDGVEEYIEEPEPTILDKAKSLIKKTVELRWRDPRSFDTVDWDELDEQANLPITVTIGEIRKIIDNIIILAWEYTPDVDVTGIAIPIGIVDEIREVK